MNQSKKRRDCPAAGRVITRAECGAGRHSRYECPEDCPFNPLSPSNYERLREIESAIEQRVTEWLILRSPDSRNLQVRFTSLMNEGDPHAIQLFLQHELHVKRDSAGSTGYDRFLRAEEAEMTNDQRVVARARRTLQVRCVEVHRVLDDLQIEAVDLLDPARGVFRICDRSMAANTCRFTTLLMAAYPLPHFECMFGVGLALEDLGRFAPEEVLGEIVRHLGGPLEQPAMRTWMLDNAERLYKAIHANQEAYREAMISATSTESSRAIYELRTPFAAGRRSLDGDPLVRPDWLRDPEADEGFVEARLWLDPAEPPPASPEAARMVLGRVLLGQSHWRLEAMGQTSLARLRTAFEERMGSAVQFRAERVDDLGETQPASALPPEDPLVVPALVADVRGFRLIKTLVPTESDTEETEAEATSRANQLHLQRFLDATNPMLEGRTAREAAAIPELRPRLIALLKAIVRDADELNLRTGRADDVNWLLSELGITELIFDPPPPRPVPEDADEDPYADDDATRAGFPEAPVDLTLPLAPRLPGALSEEDVKARLEHVHLDRMEGVNHWTELQRAGAPLAQLVCVELAGELDREDWIKFVATLLPVWLALVPRGTRVPDFPVEMVMASYTQYRDEIFECIASGRTNEMLTALRRSPQYTLALVGLEPLFELLMNHRDNKTEPEAIPRIIGLFLAFIEVLDNQLRDRGSA